MRWCLLRVSMLTLALLVALATARANNELPVDSQTADQDSDARKSSVDDGDSARARSEISREELCSNVAAAAQEHALPLSFFSNLIWQESRFMFRAVSPAGALGIAQFMPKTAAAMGLDDPFDPLQALPASARLLHHLHARYGNLGLAAAAYNAGEPLVNKWLRGGNLPRETRNYVLTITGLPVEQWKGASGPQAFPLAKRMPCVGHDAFALETVADAARAIPPVTKVAMEPKVRKLARSVRRAGEKPRRASKPRMARTASAAKSQRRS
jgi:Transglycosylase SLT domain